MLTHPHCRFRFGFSHGEGKRSFLLSRGITEKRQHDFMLAFGKTTGKQLADI